MRYFFFVLVPGWIWLAVPPALRTLWSELDVDLCPFFEYPIQDDPLNVWQRKNKKKQMLRNSTKTKEDTVKDNEKALPTPPATQ